MHFVICVFIALICLAVAVLFTEVFPKWLKVVLALIGAGTSGYALAILIRKFAILTKVFTKPQLLPTAGVCFVIMLAAIYVALTILKKKKQA